MMPLPPTKFHEILFSSFRGVALTNSICKGDLLLYVWLCLPPLWWETYCFCPVRLSVTQFVSATPLKLLNRISYGLFGSGFHGYNGLDVDTMLHLYKIYILPVLLYELGLILPQGPQLEQLEIAQRSYSSKYWLYICSPQHLLSYFPLAMLSL
jgi:hypothetical protein